MAAMSHSPPLLLSSRLLSCLLSLFPAFLLSSFLFSLDSLSWVRAWSRVGLMERLEVETGINPVG